MLVTIYTADVNLLPDLPHVNQLAFGGKAIETYFEEAASPHLNLTIDWSRRSTASSIMADEGLDTAHLESALQMVLPVGASNAVALLFGDTLADDPDLGFDASQYGYMFDLSGDPAAGVLPRLGCAIFLTPIFLKAKDEGLADQDVQEFIAFTAIHELGHVFNLWHSPDNAGFMAPNPVLGSNLTGGFEPLQATYLELIDDPAEGQFVRPGGSDFAVRPSGFPTGGDQPFEGPERQLEIKISLSHSTFWWFEPVELFIGLSAPHGGTPIQIPDDLHPHYPGMDVWITTPEGERILYRPTSRYCHAGREIVLQPGKSIHREVWIGQQASGPTFPLPGDYQLEVRLRIGNGRSIGSNRIRCNVLPSEPSSTRWSELKTYLTDASVKRALRFKRDITPDTYRSIGRILELGPSDGTKRSIHYALGKALRRSGQRVPTERAERLLLKARTHLNAASEGEQFAGRVAQISALTV